MKTIPIQIKSDGFGPLIYRTKDNVTHFYQYYTCMERMGDEHHDLYLVVEDDFYQDDVVLHSSGIVSKCLGFNIDAVKLESGQLWKKDCKKLIATTNLSVHEKYEIPLISEEIIREYAYEDQNGGLKEVILETESIYVEPEGIHSNRGYDKIVPKLNEDGEVTMYHEPVHIVDWNTFSLEELIAHLEETFKFDSSGTAKAVHELIAAYRNKGASNSFELHEKDKEVEWIKERIISEKNKHEKSGLDWELIAATKIFSTLIHRKEKSNIEEPKVCIQNGLPCGFPCFSEDECKTMTERNLEIKLENIFDDCAKKNMIVWNLSSFKQSYRKLFKSIMESLKIASNGGN